MNANVTCVTATCLLLVLSGCSGISTMPNGSPTTLDAQDVATRMSLTISPTPLTSALTYRAIRRCDYDQTVTLYNKPMVRSHVAIELQRIKKQFHVRLDEDGHVSAAMIDAQGKLYDFNLLDQERERYTTESFGAQSKAKVSQMQSSGDPRVIAPHMVNNFTLFIPDFSSNPRNPGDIAATVTQEDGQVWATYRYQGTTEIDGTVAAVFDLHRQFESRPELGTIVIGFDIVDLRNNLPIMTIMSSGSKATIRRTSCSS